MPQHWIGRVGVWTLVLAGLAAPPAPAVAGLAARKTAAVAAVRKVKPSVVSISSEKKAASTSRWPFSAEESQKSRVSGMGTGVILDERGFILTNQHVVDKVQGIVVRLSDGTVYPARVVQQDEAMDLAIVKVEAGRRLVPITIGTSSDLMEGEEVITIGNAFGYDNTVSVGIISALNRNVTLSDDQVYRNLIQTDACINPGNSGGPLVNIDGELIGINVAVRAGAQGIGFALPVDDVKVVATEMMSTRRLSGTWHGLIAVERKAEDSRSVVLTGTQAGSPAESAGFQPGDEIVRVGEVPVVTALDIERGLLEVRPGQRAQVVIRRPGQEKEQLLSLEVQALARVTADAGEQVWRLLGLRTTPVPPEYVATASPKLRGGLYVQSVLPNSPGARASIQKGDILVGMNIGNHHWETIRPDNVLYVLRQVEPARTPTVHYYLVRRNAIHQGALNIADVAIVNTRR